MYVWLNVSVGVCLCLFEYVFVFVSGLVCICVCACVFFLCVCAFVLSFACMLFCVYVFWYIYMYICKILVTLNQKAKGDHNRPLIYTKTLQRLVQPYLNILLYFRVEFPLKTRTLFPRDAGICIDNEGSKHPVDLARCCSHQSHVT